MWGREREKPISRKGAKNAKKTLKTLVVGYFGGVETQHSSVAGQADLLRAFSPPWTWFNFKPAHYANFASFASLREML
jgi:hypothetical protein